MSTPVPLFVTSLFLRLIAVVSVLACGWYDKPSLAFLPIGAIVVYALIAWLVAREDGAKLIALADQVYFVGYLSTIAAFAGIVLRIWWTGAAPENPGPILLMCGIALSTTILGLIAMTALKDLAPSEHNAKHHIENDVMADLYKVMDSFQTQTAENSPQLVEISNKTAVIIEGLNEQLAELKTNVESLRNNVSQGASSSQQFVESVEQLHQVLDEFVRLLSRKVQLELGSDGKAE